MSRKHELGTIPDGSYTRAKRLQRKMAGGVIATLDLLNVKPLTDEEMVEIEVRSPYKGAKHLQGKRRL